LRNENVSEPEDPGFDIGALLEQAQKMQEQVMAAQAQAADQEVEGHAGGGLVRITVTGGMDFRAVHIDPSAVDPNDVEMLEDLVLAALHDAVHQANEINQQAFGGLGFPGMPGMPGLPGADG
jgi:DNA-binding YbaB/EbfC family protein